MHSANAYAPILIYHGEVKFISMQNAPQSICHQPKICLKKISEREKERINIIIYTFFLAGGCVCLYRRQIAPIAV